jgi:hypothetical protein
MSRNKISFSYGTLFHKELFGKYLIMIRTFGKLSYAHTFREPAGQPVFCGRLLLLLCQDQPPSRGRGIFRIDL